MDNYSIDGCGVIHQIRIEPFKYNREYVSKTYDEAYKSSVESISHLRLGYLLAAMGRKPISVLDFGYGNGAFLRACTRFKIKTYGTDVSGYDVPEGCKFVEFENIFDKEFDVVCFFDSLEHVEDMDFIQKLKTNYVIISVPACHYRSLGETAGEKWFNNWKHRKPNEHLHHFDVISIIEFFKKHGYEIVVSGNPEDVVRTPVDDMENILTCVFKKI
jgi:hypothetical protein